MLTAQRILLKCVWNVGGVYQQEDGCCFLMPASKQHNDTNQMLSVKYVVYSSMSYTYFFDFFFQLIQNFPPFVLDLYDLSGRALTSNRYLRSF